jgi:hypothetical protein
MADFTEGGLRKIDLGRSLSVKMDEVGGFIIRGTKVGIAYAKTLMPGGAAAWEAAEAAGKVVAGK